MAGEHESYCWSGRSPLLHLGLELGAGLEVGDVPLGKEHGGVPGDVAGFLGGAALDAEGAEAPQVDGLSLGEGSLDGLGDALDGGGDGGALDAGGLCHGLDDFCFGHS